MTRLKKDCMKEGYEDLKNLLYHTAHKFQSTYGGDFDELMSISNLAFVKAYNSYTSSMGAMTTWVRFCAWHAMLHERTNETKARRTRQEDKETKTVRPNPLVDILDELSEDAKRIVRLVLTTPPELQELIESSGGNVRRIKPILSSYLQSIGWGRRQIELSFAEIKEAL